jgi:hypothetical protein
MSVLVGRSLLPASGRASKGQHQMRIWFIRVRPLILSWLQLVEEPPAEQRKPFQVLTESPGYTQVENETMGNLFLRYRDGC